MPLADLPFPVLAFNGAYLMVAKKPEQLETCTGTAWKRRFFDGLLIFDARAHKHKVAGAERLGHFGGVWGFHADFSRWYRVRVAVEPLDGGGLAEAKQQVLRSVRSPSSAWNASGRLEEVVAGVSSATSIAEIVTALDLVP